jgi:hypothetical protein
MRYRLCKNRITSARRYLSAPQLAFAVHRRGLTFSRRRTFLH